MFELHSREMVEPRNGFIIFQGREARGKLVIGYLNIIWQFARTGNNVTDWSEHFKYMLYLWGVCNLDAKIYIQ